MNRIADTALRILACVLLASMIVAAWHDVSKAWDVWFYHLPFAARLLGIVDGASYTFGAPNQARFGGFPLFGELLQGLFWKITGRVECANFVALLSIPAFAYFLRRLFDVPLHLTVLALLAVPLVQIHATACYVDLPGNTFAAMLVLLAYRQVVRREPPTVRTLAAAGALAAATANTKFQLVPIVIATSLVLVVTSLRRDSERTRRLLVVGAALPFVMATPIKNLFVHGNPVWPVELAILGHSLPHIERAYASSPDWLEHSPRPMRFAASVLELGLRPIASHARWSIDQWTPPREPGYRMGGFFGAYVVVNVIALVVGAVRLRARESKVALAFAAGLTAVTSMLPQSHELRYYLSWMIVLLALVLVVWAKHRPLVLAAVATTALAVVAWSTEGTYLYASGDSFAKLVDTKVDARVLDAVAPGARVCIDRQPWTFLYAPRFHPARSYSVQEAEVPTDCAGLPTPATP
ncbi:MAG: hypothetical protein JST00_16685 [Deltaproteobacteria bacterium]|nr:hypothetical protein [Deltaproteobacteria bacterium]